MGLTASIKRWGFGRWAIASLASAYAIVFIYMLVARPGSPEFYHAFFNFYQIAPPLFAGICGIVAAFKGKHPTRSVAVAWFFIGLGCLSFATGQSTWTYLESYLHIEVPFPSWADAGYVGSYPFLVLGMVLLFNNSQAAGRARLVLDGAIAASALGMLSWYFIIARLWATPDVSLFGKIISVAYPLGDIAIVFMAFVIFNSIEKDRSRRRSMALVGAGIILVTFSDTVFTMLTLAEKYETGSWGDWGWSFGWMLLAFACINRILSKPAAAEVSESKPKKLKGWVIALRAFGPYIAVFSAISITFGYDYFSDGKLELSGHSEVLVLGALIVIRQIFMLWENVGLTKRIGAINDDLERRVEERTRQLSHIQELTRAVNTTLDVNQVLAEGALHGCGLMDADAVAIWLPKNNLDKKSAMILRHKQGFDTHGDFLAALSSKIMFAGDGGAMVSETLPNGELATCLVTPLTWQKENLGRMVFVRWSRAFDAADLLMAEGVGVELGSALHNAMEHASAVEAADKDAVTGLFNHRAFHQRLQSTLAKAGNDGSKVSVVMLDLNNFKLFNDTYGHMAGDQVLKTVAKALVDHCPKGTVAARYGGDEFILAVPGKNGDEAEEVINGLSAKLADLGYARAGEERTIPITLSAGIATFPVDAETHHDLLAIADQNLYSAKASELSIVRTTDQQRENRALKAEGSFELLDALVTAVDNKDRYTRKHSEDVTEYALWIADELGLSQETMRVIRVAGLLHDIGKIGIPSEVLKKPGRLTPEEYEIIKRHPVLGYLIVSAIPGMEGILDGVRSHHERWDGQGYPDQFAGEQIPFLGRLLAVADAFSAMTTDRPYRQGMDWDVALEQIEMHKGTQFDPHLAEVFMRAVAKRRRATASEVEAEAA